MLAQDDEMRCRALIALVELRKVFRCASDSNEDWVRVEVGVSETYSYCNEQSVVSVASIGAMLDPCAGTSLVEP